MVTLAQEYASYVHALATEKPQAEERIADNRIEIREATAADNQSLIALTRATPMAGTISLRIDRDPDFFSLLRARGEPVAFVATCKSTVIGCISAAVYPAYVGGSAERIAHIGDLKVHPLFTGRRLSLRLIDALQARLRSMGIDLVFYLVAAGNRRVMPFCEGKYGTRATVPLGQFLVNEIIPSPLRWRSKRYRIEAATAEDLPEIATLLDRVRRQRQFARQVTVAELERTFTPSHPSGFSKMLVAREGGRVVATLTMVDTHEIKRNVLLGLPRTLRMVLAVLRVAAAAIPKLNIPRVGNPLEMLYVRYMACAEEHGQAFLPLIAEARAEAFRRRFSFLTVGLHESDPFRSAVRGLPAFTFHSLAMGDNLLTPDRVRNLPAGIPSEDFALV